MGLIINIDCNMAKKRNINGPWLYDMRRHALFHVCTFFLFHEIYLCWFKKMVSNLTAKNHTHHCHTIMRVSINVVLAWIIILVCRGERLLGFSESWFFTRKSRSSILLVPSWNLHYVVLKTNWEIFFFAFLSHFKILSIYAKMTKSYWKKENVFLIYESFLKFNFYYE